MAQGNSLCCQQHRPASPHAQLGPGAAATPCTAPAVPFYTPWPRAPACTSVSSGSCEVWHTSRCWFKITVQLSTGLQVLYQEAKPSPRTAQAKSTASCLLEPLMCQPAQTCTLGYCRDHQNTASSEAKLSQSHNHDTKLPDHQHLLQPLQTSPASLFLLTTAVKSTMSTTGVIPGEVSEVLFS